MIALLVFVILFWLTNSLSSYILILYPIHILINLIKYLTIALLALVIIFIAWSFGDE